MNLIRYVTYTIILLISLNSAGNAQSSPSGKESIIEQLERGVKAEKVDVDQLRNSVKNRIDVEASPGATVAPLPNLAKERPSVSFEIYFDYNSAQLAPASFPTLIQLGQALTDQRLGKFRFLVAGHTDASGGREYNRRLSEQRAEAVSTFLITNFKVAAARVAPIGFGMEQLKDAANPLAGINRRVEVINLGD